MSHKKQNRDYSEVIELGASGAVVQTHSNDEGGCAIDKKTKLPTCLTIPDWQRGDTARRRTVRLHEMIHAKRSGVNANKNRKYPELIRQLTEDIRVHTCYWPSTTTIRQNRDALCMAWQDIRLTEGCHNPLGLYVAIRSLAISRKTYGEANPKRPLGLVYYFDELWGVATREIVSQAISLINTDRPARVKSGMDLLTGLFATLFPPPKTAEDENEKKIEKRPPGETKTISLRREKGTVDLIELPLVEPCSKTTGKTLNMSTGRIVVPRLVSSIASGEVKRWFRKKTPSHPDGTVLIDASGSMRPSIESLIELASLIPAATIAIYAGRYAECGEIIVIARDGMRAVSLEHNGVKYPRYGGNEIDGIAIDWLLSQRRPHTMLTDLEFCGSWDSDFQIARIQNLAKIGAVNLIESASIGDLIAHYSN